MLANPEPGRIPLGLRSKARLYVVGKLKKPKNVLATKVVATPEKEKNGSMGYVGMVVGMLVG